MVELSCRRPTTERRVAHRLLLHFPRPEGTTAIGLHPARGDGIRPLSGRRNHPIEVQLTNARREMPGKPDSESLP